MIFFQDGVFLIGKAWNWLSGNLNFSNYNTLATIIASFYIGIISIWLPMTTQAIMQISDKYKDNLIVKIFEKKKINKLKLEIILFNLSIILASFFWENNKYFTISIMIFFVTSSILFLIQFRFFKKYTYDSGYIINDLIKLIKKEPCAVKIGRLFTAMKEIFKYEFVRKNFRIIETVYQKLDADCYYYKIKIIEEILDENLKIADDGYTKFTNILIKLLDYYTSKNLPPKSNNLLLILQTFLKMINKLIQESNKNILYDVINQSYKNVISNENFNLYYLDFFNEYFLNIAKMIIEKNDLELFKKLIGNFTDPEISKLDCRDMYDFAYSYMSPKNFSERKEGCSPEKKARDLCESTFKIFLKKDVDLWKEKFAELGKLYVKNSNKTKNEISQIRRNAENIKKKILNSLHEACKANNLKLIFMFVGALCVKKEKVDWIKELWTYTQPSDASINWLNKMPIHSSLNELITVYLKLMGSDMRSLKRSLEDGFSGIDVYIKQYFILLLVKLLLEEKMTGFSNNFPDLEVNELYELKNHCEALSKEAEKMKSNLEFSKLFNFKKYRPSDSKQNNLSEDLVESDIIKEEKDDRSNDQCYTDFMNDDIPRLFKEISLEIERRIVEEIKSRPITKKANAFKKEFTDYLKKLNTIKNLMINYFKAYDYETKTVKLSEKPRGLILHSFYDKIFF